MDMRDPDCAGQSPIHAACGVRSLGDPAVVAALVERHGADAHCTDDNDSNALHYACANGFVDIIRLLVRDYGVRVDTTDREGKTPLFYAAYNGRTAAVAALVQEFAADVCYRNRSDWTALHCAAMKGHASVVAFLAEDCGADVNACNYVGKSALHYAAELGHADVAAVLVRSGCCVTLTDVTDSNALHYACHRRSVLTAEILLSVDAAEQCAAVNLFGMTALLYACCPPHPHADPAAAAAAAAAGGGGAAGAEVYRSDPASGMRLLRAVLDAGASDLDAANRDGFTALMLGKAAV